MDQKIKKNQLLKQFSNNMIKQYKTNEFKKRQALKQKNMKDCWWLHEFDYEDDHVNGIIMWDLQKIKDKKKNEQEAKKK